MAHLKVSSVGALLCAALLGSLAGPAAAGELTCATVKCSAGASCRVVEGRPSCKCADFCPAVWQPLCGSDGKTYGNECELNRAACKQQKRITKASDGPCEEPRPEASCDSVRCSHGAQCELVDGAPECRCDFVCLAVYEPVCGSDDKTYGNECELRAAACRQQANLTQASEGPCRAVSGLGCDTVRCGWGARCRLVQGRPRCECPSACAAVYRPVCGSDGKTYGNSCALGVAACRQRKTITVVSEGRCPTGSSTKGTPTVELPAATERSSPATEKPETC